MSMWYETKKEGLEIDGDEINIYVTTDDGGNVYTTVKIKDMIELLQFANVRKLDIPPEERTAHKGDMSNTLTLDNLKKIPPLKISLLKDKGYEDRFRPHKSNKIPNYGCNQS